MKNKTRHPLYERWRNIKQKCNNPKATGYNGVGICIEWNQFESFVEWAISNGWDESKFILRIDRDHPYSPANCYVSESNPCSNKKPDSVRRHPLYIVHHSMIKRCHKPGSTGYDSYGARGIRVCITWMDDIQEFYSWCESNGWRPGLEIDRIDNNKGYYPENCRFVTHKENANNRRDTVRLPSGRTIEEAADDLCVSVSTIKSRIRKGWGLANAETTPKLQK